MAIYLVLSTLTGDGRKAIEEYPERLKELNKMVTGATGFIGRYVAQRLIKESTEGEFRGG